MTPAAAGPARPASRPATAARGAGRGTAPSLRVEKRLLRSGHTLLAACDEVGRGALGGPVTVGMVLVDASVQRPLAGVRDSKLLTPGARVALLPRIRRWVVAHAVGHASAAEIDEHGIIAALRMAGHRAMAQLPAHPDVVLLDGNHDWLSRPRQPSLFDDTPFADAPAPLVRTMIKADLQCSSVAAASVLAKTERDAIMVRLASLHPGYGWDENKGYSTAAHADALRRLGPCVHHRQSWRLPELLPAECDALFDVAADPGAPSVPAWTSGWDAGSDDALVDDVDACRDDVVPDGAGHDDPEDDADAHAGVDGEHDDDGEVDMEADAPGGTVAAGPDRRPARELVRTGAAPWRAGGAPA